MQFTTYHNFDLIIERDEAMSPGRISVHEAPAGSATARFTDLPPALPLDELEGDLEQRRLKQYGLQLYRVFFDNEVGLLLHKCLLLTKAQNIGLRLRVCTDSPELAAIPWEYLVDPESGDFLSLSAYTPIIRYLRLAEPVFRESPSLPIRILVVIANPKDFNDRLDVEYEQLNLQQAVSDLQEQQLVEVEYLDKATLTGLQQRLSDENYHVLHFIGHGFFHDGPSASGLVFENDEGEADFISADKLAPLLRDHRTLMLAFLNACHAGRSGRESVFAGTAQRLVRSGIPAAIAMQWRVSNRAASVLTGRFYKQLSAGHNLETALAEARRAVEPYNGYEWGVPILFSRLPDSRLFRIEPEGMRAIPYEFSVPSAELDRLDALYIPPDVDATVYQRAYELLSQKHILIITGALGLGKRMMALRIAVQRRAESQVEIVRTFRNTPIEEIKHLRGCIIIIPDGLGLFQWERKDIEKEIPLLTRLAESNFLIITTSEEVLAEGLQETRLEEWDPIQTNRVALNATMYSTTAFQQMLKKHVEWGVQQGRISSSQVKLLTRLQKQGTQFVNLLNNLRIPLDVRRFVDDYLHRVNDNDELLSILRRFGNLRDELTIWFNAISNEPRVNDDLQCFVFLIALFEGFERKALWDWYCRIVQKLKRLNPDLVIRPFGSMIKLTDPYITSMGGTPTFAHPSFQRAALQAIATAYREYFLELLGEFEEAAIPDTSVIDPQIKDKVRQTQRFRTAITIAASCIAQYDFDAVRAYTIRLASARRGAISSAAADIMLAAASNRSQLPDVLQLLQRWGNQRTADAWPLRWTAAITFGRMNEIAPAQSIEALLNLAADPHTYVRSVIPSALRSYTQLYPLPCRSIYTELAATSDAHTRREVSRSLRSLVYQNPEFVESVFDDWLSLDSINRQLTLARTCLIIPSRLYNKRLDILLKLLADNPLICQKAMADALSKPEEKPDLRPGNAWKLMRELVLYDERGYEMIVPLASLLEHQNADLFWHILNEWARDRVELRLAAAATIAHWKIHYPEKARPLLALLEGDFNSQVAMTTTSPVDPIPVDVFKSVLSAPLLRKVEHIDSNNSPVDLLTDLFG